MKKLIALLVVAALVVVVAGCPSATTSKDTKSTGGSGGPTDNKKTDPKTTGPGGGTATKGKIELGIDGAGEVKQGAKLPLKVKAKRGDYKGEIKIDATVVDADKNKVTIEEKGITIGPDKDEATVTLVVANETPEGEVVVNIIATGKDLEDAKGSAKAKVIKK